MEDKEFCLTGYCRRIDQSRMVLVEVFNGETEVDCDYFCCPHAGECTIAKQLKEQERAC